MKRIAETRRSLPADVARELWDAGVGRHLLAEPIWLKGERPEMLPARDPEAFRERKRAAREAARERAAIQMEPAMESAEPITPHRAQPAWSPCSPKPPATFQGRLF